MVHASNGTRAPGADVARYTDAAAHSWSKLRLHRPRQAHRIRPSNQAGARPQTALARRMKATVRPSYPRLSTAERHLLSAATQARTSAQGAWEGWRTGNRIETAEPKVQALFGMVYANLLVDL